MKLEVLGNILDKEQTKCALKNNINTIIIAGAGSGKSLTMVGKIKYLVKEKHINIEEILCITFTNDAANSLETKIKKELNTNCKVYTFHKLALEIIKEHNITFSIAEPDLLEYLVNEILISLPNQTYFQKLFLNSNYEYSLDFYNYKKTIIRFINLFKANYSSNYFSKILKKCSSKDLPFIKIIYQLYQTYELEKSSQGLIDFDDIISLATNLVKEKGLKKNYKYIIIDEYQDTSKVRENLIKEIIKKTKALITVVGDDFQSIYHFSGCDLNNFLNFPHNFKPAKKLYLTNTYRNSKELIYIAGHFIMKNPRQITKNLTSSKTLAKPLVILYYKNKTKDFFKALQIINSPNLMILGRNNNDLINLISAKYLFNNQVIYKNYNIYYKTIHKAKGLEEDNVLIINLTNTLNSLPTKIKDERILKYVLKEKNLYPYEEERRLFYVALTRTKNYCYLYVSQTNPSIFVTELIKNYAKYINFIKL